MKNAEQELLEIRSMMERSTRFLSLSGLSGILVGVYAVLAAATAYYFLYFPGQPFGFDINEVAESSMLMLFVIAGICLLLSVGTVVLLSIKKIKKNGGKVRTSGSKRFLLAFFTPLLVGGLFVFALLVHQQITLIAPATLIFYGLALLNASHFTLSDIRYLAYCQLIVGAVAAFMPGFGLVFWTVGFGLLHIVYGVIMYVKYDR